MYSFQSKKKVEIDTYFFIVFALFGPTQEYIDRLYSALVLANSVPRLRAQERFVSYVHVDGWCAPKNCRGRSHKPQEPHRWSRGIMHRTAVYLSTMWLSDDNFQTSTPDFGRSLNGGSLSDDNFQTFFPDFGHIVIR